MKTAKWLLTTIACLSCSTLIHAKEAITLKTATQHTLQYYLTHEGKAEGVTGIGATIVYPDHQHMVTNNFATGVIGYAPYNTEAVTPAKLFQIGSITKSFIAALILQLEAEGKLSIEDKIGTWFPEYPNWKDVTIKQLLNMTSGIPSYTRNEVFVEKIYSNIQTHVTPTELLNYASPEKPIKKGKNAFDYSNTNYILAGLIVEKVTGLSIGDALQERLIKPFGLKNTYYPVTKDWEAIREQLAPRMVHGYYRSDDGKMVDITDGDLSWAGAAGAMISTTDDIATWVKVLYHGLFVPEKARKQTLAELESFVSMKTGQPITRVTASDPKGFGLGIGRIYQKGLGQFWIYEGSSMGYRVRYIWRSCNDITAVAALNNKAGNEDPKGNGGNHSQELLNRMYQNIMTAYPKLNCHD